MATTPERLPVFAKGGVTKFTELEDTPKSYTGQAGKALRVKTTEDGLEFITGLPPAAHASTHESGGSDAINPANIGADWNKLVNKPSSFPPSAHATTHAAGGSDQLSHSSLAGLSADDHTQYLNTTRHDTTARHPLGTVVPHDSFLGLTDTPTSYTGLAGRAVVVKSTENGLELSFPATPINTQTVTSYTLDLSDIGKCVQFNTTADTTVTIPTNASVPFPIGTKILIQMYGTGTVTISPATGVTLRDPFGIATISTQYDVRALLKVGTDEWIIQ